MTLSLDHLRRCAVAADLGAARTRVYAKQHGLIVDEPSVVAMNTKTGALIAVGAPAERMAGRTPANIRVIRPVNGGTVVDIEMAQRMLRAMVGAKLRRTWRLRPLLRAAVCIPHDADPLARRAALETLVGLGARRVELVDSLITAGIGCGLPVEEPEATLIVQVGAATTEIAVLSLGSIVAADKVPMGGETIDRALVQHLRNQHELLLPSQAVRPLHAALAGPFPRVTEVSGRDVATGLARTVKVDPEELRAAVQPPLTGLLDTIRAVLHRCPPDLVADLAERGVTLTGGAARLPGLDTAIRGNTGMPVNVAEEPGLCAVQGLGALIEGKVRPLGRPGPRGGRGAGFRQRRRAQAQGAAERTAELPAPAADTARAAGVAAGAAAGADAARADEREAARS
ncbi:Rod shape-determining protein MreB [Streptomyces sp. MP131-18]|nr:Rod shape-determining protein MreB [Streptomyces sp. MP131-18]